MNLRNLFLSIFIGLPILLNAQVIKGKITDSKTNEPLPYANLVLLSKNRGVTTNELGIYEFAIHKDLKDSLLVSYIGYASQKIALHQFKDSAIQDFNIELTENSSLIDEIVLEVKKQKYSATKTLGVKKKKRSVVGTQYGSEVVSFIENEKHKKGKISQVDFFVKENSGSQFKTLPTYYRIKFYEFDAMRKQPGKLLLHKDILFQPENKTKKISIDVSTYNILYPVNGICIGIETIKPSYITTPKNPMYTTTPSLVWVHGKKLISWTSFMGRKWSKQVRKSVFNKKFYTNPLIHLKVKYRK